MINVQIAPNPTIASIVASSVLIVSFELHFKLFLVMKLKSTKKGVSLHMSLLEWTEFKLLMAHIWNDIDVTMYPSMHHCLSELSEIPEVKRAISIWSDYDKQ